MSLREKGLERELIFTTSRSGGPGGQHVNKVETRVELAFAIDKSEILSDFQKQRLSIKLAARISKEGMLKIVVDSARSQLRNKEIAIERFYVLLEESFKRVKRRIPTKPSRASRAKRMDNKRMRSEKKERRRKL